MSIAREDIEFISAKIIGVIYCEQDVLMPESLQEYSKIIPSNKQYIINDCAHLPWVETPGEFYHILLRTMTRTH